MWDVASRRHAERNVVGIWGRWSEGIVLVAKELLHFREEGR